MPYQEAWWAEDTFLAVVLSVAPMEGRVSTVVFPGRLVGKWLCLELEGTLDAVSSQELLAPIFKRLAGCYARSMKSTSKATVSWP